MSTAVVTAPARRLPAGAIQVLKEGLLSRVGRPCPDHGGEGACVATKARVGCLIYWCEEGSHHFSIR